LEREGDALKIVNHNRYGIYKGRFFYLNQEKCLEANENGAEIFWAVNSFKSTVRDEKSLLSLDYLFADLDKYPKKEMLEIISNGLPPTILIETKNGFHIYWELKKPMTIEYLPRYKKILQQQIIPFYKSDNNAKDAARVLRVPGFNHLKDPSSPFLVKLKSHNPTYLYNFSQFEYCYRGEFFKKQIKANFGIGDFGCDVRASLSKLSGRAEVNGDIFTFKKNSSGLYQILSNGKSTPNWVDANGGIGNCGYLWQYLAWYGHCADRIKNILKELNIAH
jgi:hypothetical protein